MKQKQNKTENKIKEMANRTKKMLVASVMFEQYWKFNRAYNREHLCTAHCNCFS